MKNQNAMRVVVDVRVSPTALTRLAHRVRALGSLETEPRERDLVPKRISAPGPERNLRAGNRDVAADVRVAVLVDQQLVLLRSRSLMRVLRRFRRKAVTPDLVPVDQLARNPA
jgi:hypothetical protein